MESVSVIFNDEGFDRPHDGDGRARNLSVRRAAFQQLKQSCVRGL